MEGYVRFASPLSIQMLKLDGYLSGKPLRYHQSRENRQA